MAEGMNVDIQELKRKAEAAIARGEEIGEDSWYESHELQSVMDMNASDSGFISAANPQTVLSLITEIESLKHDLEQYMMAANAEATYANELKAKLDALRSSSEADIERICKACIEACKGEYLVDATGTADDLAYDNAVFDCIGAINRVLAQLKGENNGN